MLPPAKVSGGGGVQPPAKLVGRPMKRTARQAAEENCAVRSVPWHRTFRSTISIEDRGAYCPAANRVDRQHSEAVEPRQAEGSTPSKRGQGPSMVPVPGWQTPRWTRHEYATAQRPCCELGNRVSGRTQPAESAVQDSPEQGSLGCPWRHRLETARQADEENSPAGRRREQPGRSIKTTARQAAEENCPVRTVPLHSTFRSTISTEEMNSGG